MHDENVLIQQIHAEFENDLNGMFTAFDEGGRKATDAFDLVEQVEKVKPNKMGAREFYDQVQYWQRNYPQNNFITEKQIAEICLKYNLIMGPAILFNGEVPEKNKAEISRFALRPQDETFDGLDAKKILRNTDDMSEWGRAFDSFARAASMLSSEMPTRRKRELQTFRAAFTTTSPTLPLIIPFGENFVLKFRSRPGEKFGVPMADLFLKAKVNGSEWLVSCCEIDPTDRNLFEVSRETSSPDFGMVFMEGGRMRMRTQPAEFSYQHTVTLRLPIADADFKNISLNENACKMVVAPGTMFAQTEETDLKDGYRITFKERIGSPAPSFNFFLNDPIVLQPVPGGYLVVSKWGAEANIPEIQNGASN